MHFDCGFGWLCVKTEGSVVCTCGYRERQTDVYRFGPKFSKRESGRERRNETLMCECNNIEAQGAVMDI